MRCKKLEGYGYETATSLTSPTVSTATSKKSRNNGKVIAVYGMGESPETNFAHQEALFTL